jgi:ectoine hydroxylase-related dioxygenase (phytanoyl-CoA dioxygenase family)
MLERHERNREFAWTPLRPPYRRISAAQAAQYDAEGYILLRGAFSQPEIRAVADAIEPFERKTEEFLRAQPGGKVMIAKADAITFTVHISAKSQALRAFSVHPVFQDLCADLVGPKARLYWDQAVYKKPGNLEEFPWHQDNGYTYTEPQQYLTCWVALSDATQENGCPWVVPGLHKMGTLKHWMTPLGWRCLTEAPDAVPVPAKAGDVVVFSSLTPHRTGPNLTAGVRQSYILQYAPDGAVAFPPGAEAGVPQNDPQRQYVV